MNNEAETFEPIRNREMFPMNNYIHSLLKGQLGKYRTGIVSPKGGYSRFQVTGMIEWGQKSKPNQIPRAPTKPKKIPGPKFNPKYSHAKFLSHRNFQKTLHDITRITETLALNTQKNTC